MATVYAEVTATASVGPAEDRIAQAAVAATAAVTIEQPSIQRHATATASSSVLARATGGPLASNRYRR